MTIASLRQQGSSVRTIARTLDRSPGTISRELARNRHSELGYASAPAQALSAQRRDAARGLAKLDPGGVT
jgi:IS30 family transposase